MAHQAGRFSEAAEALEEAIESLLARGDLASAVRAMGTLSSVFFSLGNTRWRDVDTEALTLAETVPPGPEQVDALEAVSHGGVRRGRPEDALRHIEQAHALNEKLGLGHSARGLQVLGMSSASLGDPGGLDDLRAALDLATGEGQGELVAGLHNNLGHVLWSFEGPDASLGVLRSGIAFDEARGLAKWANFTRGTMLDRLFDVGEHDEALQVAADLADRIEKESALGPGGCGNHTSPGSHAARACCASG